jgi:GT2 family glycosyltransferase
MSTGIGIVTFKRPDRYRALSTSISTHLSPVVDEVVAYHDGRVDTSAYTPEVLDHPWPLHDGLVNQGVAAAKNWCMRTLMKRGCEWLFIAEDDMSIDSPEAVTAYLLAAEASGERHLNFHAHGPANRIAMFTNGLVTYWPAIVGSWSLYHRDDLEKVGLMDTGLVNAFEHVEHTCRLMRAGACHRWPGVADATGSEYWLHEQPGAIEDTSIPTEGRFAQQRAAILRWRQKDPETLRWIFGEVSPWEREPAHA